METGTRTARITFDAGEAATAPMTWGQEHIWRPLQRMPEISADFNNKRTLQAPGVPLPRALDALRGLVERHHALRTLFVDHPDGPRQQVEGSGEYVVHLVDGPPGAEALPVAEAVAARLGAAAFDMEKELPARFALVLHDDRVHAVAMVTSHVIADGRSVEVLLGDLRGFLSGRPPSAPAAWTPLDQAAHEASDAGRRRGRQALAHWRRQLTAAPAALFDGPPLPADDLPIRRWRLTSAAVAEAAQRLADRTRTSTSTVLLAAAGLLLCAVAGREAVALQVISSNRYAPRLRDLVAHNAQDGLFVFRPVEDVLETIRRTHAEARFAYYHATYPPAAREALVDEVARERGGGPDLSAYFNDGRNGREWTRPPTDEVTRDAFARLRGRSVLEPMASLPTHDMTFYLAVSRLLDRCLVSILVDTRRAPEPVWRAVLPGVEALLAEALFRPVAVDEVAAVAGLPPGDRPDPVGA